MGSLRRKKGSRSLLCFRVIDVVPEKKRMNLGKQMSSKWSQEGSWWLFSCICGIFFLPLNPSTTTVYAQSGFYPQFCILHPAWFLLALSVQGLHFTLSLHFIPGPQSASYSDLTTIAAAMMYEVYTLNLKSCHRIFTYECHPSLSQTWNVLYHLNLI